MGKSGPVRESSQYKGPEVGMCLVQSNAASNLLRLEKSKQGDGQRRNEGSDPAGPCGHCKDMSL